MHALFTHAECAATSEALEREDVDLPYVFIDGEKHHRIRWASSKGTGRRIFDNNASFR